MNDLLVIVEVTLFFMLRVGLPVLLLITLGVAVEHWQNDREKQHTEPPIGAS